MTAESDSASAAAKPSIVPVSVGVGAEDGAGAPAVPGRRRLLRGGLGAAPVLMTLASGPVGAAACTQASAFASLHVSGKRPIVACAGRTPAVWFDATETQWSIASKTKFNAVFSPSIGDGSATLRQVVNPNGGYDPVARHLVAALLNTSLNPPLTPATILTPTTVKSIWTTYKGSNYYEPTAGIRWSGPRIIEWLLTTFAA